MLKTVFQNRARYFLEPIENPFRAVTIYTENGRHEGAWCCASTHMYGL